LCLTGGRRYRDRGERTTPHCPYIEFLPANLCDSLPRKELVADELKIVNGQLPLPRKPGLGIEVNRQALRKFEVNA